MIGIHIRRGDYVTIEQRDPSLRNPFYVAPSRWYVDWLREHWDRWSTPVVYLASDEPRAVVEDFAEFPCLTLADLGELPQALPAFFIDFHLLASCQALAISNSTFSFVAAMLSDAAEVHARPDRTSESLIDFDPWNSMPLVRGG